MPEAISPKPLAVGVWRCHHRLQGAREPYRQVFIQIKNGRVSSIGRFVVECPSNYATKIDRLTRLQKRAVRTIDKKTLLVSLQGTLHQVQNSKISKYCHRTTSHNTFRLCKWNSSLLYFGYV